MTWLTWPVIIAAGYALLVGGMGGFLTKLGPWYYALRYPSWKPPDWLFAPAWTLILGAAATSAVFAWDAVPPGWRSVVVVALFILNGLLNMLWSALYFRLERPDYALAEVCVLQLTNFALIILLWPVSQTAALYMVPYAVWVAFAGFLNIAIVRLNRPFGPVRLTNINSDNALGGRHG
jgi:tryptophan-rich sensory protein